MRAIDGQPSVLISRHLWLGLCSLASQSFMETQRTLSSWQWWQSDSRWFSLWLAISTWLSDGALIWRHHSRTSKGCLNTSICLKNVQVFSKAIHLKSRVQLNSKMWRWDTNPIWNRLWKIFHLKSKQDRRLLLLVVLVRARALCINYFWDLENRTKVYVWSMVRISKT